MNVYFIGIKIYAFILKIQFALATGSLTLNQVENTFNQICTALYKCCIFKMLWFTCFLITSDYLMKPFA